MQSQSPTAAEVEREREIKFTVTLPSVYGTASAARATVDELQHALEVRLQRSIKITGRKYG